MFKILGSTVSYLEKGLISWNMPDYNPQIIIISSRQFVRVFQPEGGAALHFKWILLTATLIWRNENIKSYQALIHVDLLMLSGSLYWDNFWLLKKN